MDHIVILNPGTTAAEPITDDHGFIETFAYYDAAKELADEYKEAGDCEDYAIYKLVKHK